MAITFRTNVGAGGTSGTSNRTIAIGSAVIQVGDLLVVAIALSGNTNAAPTCSDDQGGTYTRVAQALRNSSADNMAVFVRNQLVASAVLTTITVASGSNTAGRIGVFMLSGALRTGSSDVVRKIGATPQVGTQANGSAGATPAPALPAAALTGNMTISGVANGTATPVITAPVNWTHTEGTSVSNPTTGLETNRRASGFTGTTITFGSTSSTAWSSFALELDASAPPTTVTAPLIGPTGTLFAPKALRKVTAAFISLPTSLKTPTQVTQIATKNPPLLGPNTLLFAPTKVNRTQSAPLKASATTLYAPVVTGNVMVPKIGPTGTLYAPSTKRAISPGLIGPTNTLYVPKATGKPQPPLITSNTTLYAPSGIVGPLTLNAPLHGPNTLLFAPAKTKLTISLVSVGTFGVGTFGTGLFGGSDPRIGPTGVLFAPQLSGGAEVVYAELIESNTTLFAPRIATMVIPRIGPNTLLFAPVVGRDRGPSLDPDFALRLSKFRDPHTYYGRSAR